MYRTACVALLCAAILAPLVTAAAPPAPPSERLPEGAVLRIGSGRLQHPTRIASLSLSAKGHLLVTADAAGTVRAWDTASGGMRLELRGAGTHASLSRDGEFLATAKRGDPARLWDAATGKQVRELPRLLGGCVAFSAEGRRVAGSDGTTVIVCGTATGRVLGRYEGLKYPPDCLAFTLDGKSLAACCNGRGSDAGWSALVWDVASGDRRCRPVGEASGRVTDLAFSSDGTSLAVATPDHVRLYAASNGKRTQNLGSAHTHAVAFDAAGRMITGGDVSLWEVQKTEPSWSARQGRDYASRVAFSADGSVIASNAARDTRVRLWDMKAAGKERRFGAPYEEVRAVAWSADGNRLATGYGDGAACLWAARNGAFVRTLSQPEERARTLPRDRNASRELALLAISADGRSVVGAGVRWDVDTGKVSKLPKGRPVAYSPEDRLAVVAPSGELQIQDMTGRVLHRLRLAYLTTVRPHSLAFSPDGRLLIVGHGGTDSLTVSVFDTTTGKRLRQTTLKCRRLERLSFSPDGKAVAVYESGGQVQVYDIASGRERLVRAKDEIDRRKPSKGKSDRSRDALVPMAFSADSAVFATTEGKKDEVVLFETATGQRIRSWAAHEGRVLSMCFSPDGRFLLTGGADAMAYVWRVIPLTKRAWDRDAADRVWLELAKDAPEAYDAIAELTASPKEAAAMLGERLRAIELGAERTAKLIADLDDEEFDTRQKAERALASARWHAEPALSKALAGGPPLEQRRRIQKLLARLSGGEPRDRRAVVALERIGTPAARAVLEEMSKGGLGQAGLDAKAALARLAATK